MGGWSEGTDRFEDGHSWFTTTRWNVIRAADGSQTGEAKAARETLCRIYWYPVYARVRHWGHTPEDAQDLTQEFFSRLLKANAFGRADPSRGRLRSFLLASLKNFLHEAREYTQAQKRGGGCIIIPWDEACAEARVEDAGAEGGSPDLIFERNWAISVLDQAANRLRREYEASGRGALFEAVKSHVTPGSDPTSLAEAATTLGSTVSAMKSAALRLRRRFYEIIRDEIAQTLEDPAELDDELRHLLSVILPQPARP